MIWLVHYLPESLILVVTGIVLGIGAVITMISWATKFLNNPILHMYRLPIQIVGNLFLALGIYFHGGYLIESDWRAKVAAAEKKIQEYQSQVPQVNEKVVVKYKTKLQVVERRVVEVKEHNAANEAAINQDCTLSDAAIESYNRSLTKPVKEEK